MPKEKKPEHHGGEHERKPKKKHLHQLITTQAKDGTFGHEHIYKDHPDDAHAHPPVFAGTSADMEDLHQHMDDHFGGGAGGGGPEEEEEEQGGAGGAQPGA